MIVDSHVHILPAGMRDSRAALADADPWFDMCHQGGRSIITADELLATMDATGIDRSVCFGWPFANPAPCAEVNDHLIQVQRDHGDRLTCFATVSPARPGAVDELRRCADAGLRGVGELNADAQGFDLSESAADEVARACNALGIPLVLHCSEPVGHDYPGKGTATPDKVAAFALRHPGLLLMRAPRRRAAVLRAHAGGCRALQEALVRHRGRAISLRADRVSRGDRSVWRRPVALRVGPSAAPGSTVHRCLRAGGTHAGGTDLVMGGTPRACLVCDNVPLPLRICVSASEALFGPFATLWLGGETGARQPVLRLFRDQDWGLRPPSVVATDAPMRDREHVEAGTSCGRFRTLCSDVHS